MKTNVFCLALCVACSWWSVSVGQETSTEEKGERTIAIVGADVYTVTGEVIRGGTVVVKGNKIVDVGQSIKVPEGAEVIDATGKVVTPGFVAINMAGVGVRSAPQNQDKLADAIDPFDRNIKFSLGIGITTGCVELSSRSSRFGRRRNGEPEERFPGLEPSLQEYVTEAQLDYGDENTSLCPCCGLPILPTEPITEAPATQEQPRKHAVLKMSYGNLDSMLVKENVFYSPSPGALTGALNRHNWRRDVKIARESADRIAKMMAQRTASQSSGQRTEGNRPSGNQGRSASSRRSRRGSTNEDLMRLVRKEVPMRVTANTVDEIRDMISLATELDYELIIEGGVEAWLVANELSEAEVKVIYTPRNRRQPRRGREETSGSSIESTGIFQDRGVSFATASLSSSISMGGIAGRDLSSLPLEAAFAVRGGADNQTALESITIVPARMLGLDDRIGSIEKGKDADLLILNGSPLDYRTYVETAIVDGNVCYQRDEDRVYPVFER